MSKTISSHNLARLDEIITDFNNYLCLAHLTADKIDYAEESDSVYFLLCSSLKKLDDVSNSLNTLDYCIHKETDCYK